MAKNPNEESPRNAKRRHHHYAPAGAANYTILDGIRVMRAIEIITASGGAVRLGKTRDGGAFAIGVYGDAPEPYTDYLRPDDDLLRYLEELAESMHQLPTS